MDTTKYGNLHKRHAVARPVVPVLAGLVLALWGAPGPIACGSSTARAETPRPNVILVMTDDQGYGDLACHGNEIIRTPNLDRLHAESVRLTDFHVSPCCTPTRAGLMTGQNPVRVGAWGTTWGRSLPDAEAPMMAEVFADAGYRTGVFGKWHLGDNYPFRPQDRGFQEVLIHGGGNVGQTPDYWGNNYFDDTYFHNGVPVPVKGYYTDVWFDAAMEFISQEPERPFFVYIPTNAPHSPYWVAEEYSRPYAEKGVSSPMAEFYGMITNIDENMGRLAEFLETAELAENTILIFLTDNGTSAGYRDGQGFNAGMRGTKGSLYEGGHRVPFFLRWPGGGLTGGRDIPDLTAHLDVFPTLVELCGLEIPERAEWDGISLAPLLSGQVDTLPDREIVVQFRQSPEPPEKGSATVMSGHWRLVNDRELYGLRSDPGQKNDVAAEHPEVVEKLRLAYKAWWDEVSPGLAEYRRIVLGADQENPAWLTAFDWHTVTPWNQGQILRGMQANGFWAVEIATAGRYQFRLRRWPQELDLPITAAPSGAAAIRANEARLKIGGFDVREPIPASAAYVEFELDLPAGPTELQTWFSDADHGESRGAYYVYVQRREVDVPLPLVYP